MNILKLNRLKIGMRLMIAIAVTFVTIFSAMVVFINHEQKHLALLQAESLAQTAHQMTMANLLFMKVTKTIKKRSLYYEQVYQSKAIRDLRVLRAEPVIKEMGDGDEIAMNPDELEKRVMASGQMLLEESNDPKVGHVLRAIFPAKASTDYLGKNCLDSKCHTEPKEGDVLGAVSMKIVLSEMDDDVAETRDRLIIGAVLITLSVLAFVLLFISRVVSRPLAEMTGGLQAIAQGEADLNQRLPAHGGDEISDASRAFNDLMEKLCRDVDEAKRVNTEMTRIKFALDSVEVPVTVADENNAIIYMNDSAQELWNRLGAEIRACHPQFNPAHLVGKHLADYIDDAEIKRRFSEKPDRLETFSAEISGRCLRIATSPVRGEDHSYIGNVAQWQDRTAEIAVEKEIEGIVNSAAQGDFSHRLTLAGKEGFFLSLTNGLNSVLETSSDGLDAVAQVLGALAQGDLTQTMDGVYQGTFGRLQDDARSTVEQLQHVVGQIKESTETIHTAAREIAAGNQDLSTRTETQALSLEETARSMDKLAATVRQNAESARHANELATASNALASRSGDIVKNVVRTMTEIQGSSHKIADIVGIIDSISFQTNILALNAAVEAARAGAQGRGFAVVATEVRNLAQRSADAAKEIKSLIAESSSKVDSGAKLVDQAGTTMHEVVDSFQQVAKYVEEISRASLEQSQGIEEVAQTLGTMDKATQQNAALVEQAAAAAESLEEQADQLAHAVGAFKLH